MSGRLSVIIPTRNELDNVPRLLDALRSALAGFDYELVFVDDSSDGTERALAEAAAADTRVVVHHRNGARGLATAVVAGFELGRGETLGVLDADLQHPPTLFPVMLRRMAETQADVVVASRYLPGAARPGLTWWRGLVSQITRLLAWVALRAARRSTDPLSGCFLVRRTVIEGVRLRPVGFKILLEILVRGRYHRVAEVPYEFGGRASGRTKATPRQGLDLLRHIVTLAATSPDDARVWKFLLVGASGVGVNMAVFWLLSHPLGVYYLQAGIVAGLLSTFTNFLLNNTFTWADRRPRALAVFFHRMGKYYVATWVGYLVYLAVLWGLTDLGMIPLLSNLIAIGVGGMLNYAAHSRWTWGQQGHGPG